MPDVPLLERCLGAFLPALVGVPLQVLADALRAEDRVGGYPAESVSVTSISGGWTVLEFGSSEGDIPIALSPVQVARLQRLLAG